MACAGESDPGVQAQRMKREMQDYTADTFLPYVGHTFPFEALAEGDISATTLCFRLLEVERPALGARPEGFREPFKLIFTSIGEPRSVRGLHRIAHEDFAPCEWLLARVFVPGRDPRVPYYEAVFG